jgi:hypothetical protein
MQMTQPTEQDLAHWKQVYQQYRPRLKPNRISGAALYSYLGSRYPLLPLDDPRASRLVTENILSNKVLMRQLPRGCVPEPVCCTIAQTGDGAELYRAQDAIFAGIDILVGIDLISGYFLVEGSSLLWDELYAHRGLNEDDMENVFAVAEYISCLERFGMLERVLTDV